MKAESSLRPMWQDLVDIAPGRWDVVEGNLLVNHNDTLETKLEGIDRRRVAAAEVQLKDAAQFGELKDHYDILFPDKSICPVRTPIGNKDLPEDVFAKAYLLVAPEDVKLQRINLCGKLHSEDAERLERLGIKCFGRYSFRTNVSNYSPYAFFISGQVSSDGDVGNNIRRDFEKINVLAKVIPFPGQLPCFTTVTIHKRRDTGNELKALVQKCYPYAKVRVVDVDSLPSDIEKYLITVGGEYVLNH